MLFHSHIPLYHTRYTVIVFIFIIFKQFRIKKYKAIILQGKKNDVEALKWYRAAFEDNSTDELVIDSLITLSLMNKRKVSKEVLNAAIKTDTSRLHMLAAACYLNEATYQERRVKIYVLF